MGTDHRRVDTLRIAQERTIDAPRMARIRAMDGVHQSRGSKK